MKFFKVFLILFYLSFANVYSDEILQKYSEVSVYSGCVIFNATDFQIGEKIYLEIETKGDCSNELYYQHYNDMTYIYGLPELVTRTTTSSSTSVNGKTTTTYYFTIKKSTDINDLQGNYIQLYYDCDDKYKIKNTESSGATKLIIIVCCVVGAVLVVIIIIIVLCCYRRRVRNRIGYVYPVNPYYSGQQVYPQYGNGPFIYQTPNMNMIMYNSPNNMNYGNIPQNIQIVQNGSAPQPKDKVQPSSNRENFSNKKEKPNYNL